MPEQSEVPNSFVAPSPEELAPFFPAYEIEAFIAQGGMGAVYKARQISLDRSVAIKILPREFGEDEQFRASFEAEAKAMARLNHPNLIGVFDFGDVDEMLFIIMEHVKGKALYYSIHEKAIDPPIAIKLISKISRGLAHAHGEGILHRDIKPANILLDMNADPKIGDFGLARPLDNDGAEGVVFGTPGYTAPEVYSRQHPVDQRSDIFSVGAMLYELLKGLAPEEGATSMVTSLDPRLDAILAKATHHNPDQRYTDVSTFADEIDALAPLLSGPHLQTTLAPPASSPIPELKSSKSSLVPLFVTAAILLGCGAAAFVLLKDKSQPEEQELVTTAPITPAPEVISPPEPIPASPVVEPALIQKSEPKIVKVMPAQIVEAKTEPEPVSIPAPEKTEKERPLDSLKRIQEALVSGKRDEFPVGAVTRNDSVFFLIRKRSDWQEANRIAQEFGASLASLQTSEDLRWVRNNYNL
ncbi:protein kinase, partial [Akkermansiaceae bacterium]|nr:protein kinase [Akkermansiaceae bacterium]